MHGKGPEAVLKTYVNGWLRQHRDVLAFVSAPKIRAVQAQCWYYLSVLKKSEI